MNKATFLVLVFCVLVSMASIAMSIAALNNINAVDREFRVLRIQVEELIQAK